MDNTIRPVHDPYMPKIPALRAIPAPADTFTPGLQSGSAPIDAKKVADTLLSPSGPVSPPVLWQYDAGGAVQGKPYIGSDGTLFVTLRKGSAVAIDTTTGRKKWEFPTSDGLYSDITPGQNGMILVPGNGRDGKLHALDEKTGAQVWEFDLGGEPSRSVSMSPDGTIFAGSSIFTPVSSIASACSDGRVFAIDGKTGQKKWEFQTKDLMVSTPTPGPHGSVYCGGYDSTFYSIDEKTGEKKWEFKADGWISSSPAFGGDDLVYFGSWDGTLYALDCDHGGTVWQFKTGGDVRGNPLVGPDGTVYIGSFDGMIYAIDGSTGAKRWSRETGDEVLSSPVMDKDGILYVGNKKGTLSAFHSDTGAKKWEFQTKDLIHGSVAIGSDGIVYVGSNDGNLYALDPRELDKLIEQAHTEKPSTANEKGSSIEVTDEMIIIDGIKLPIKKKNTP